jgi:hypothetical protein
MTEPSPYTQADRDRWRQLILAKGKEVADKLERVLNNKNVSLEEISLFKDDEPAETKEKRLRRFLDHLMARLRKVEDPRFGYDTERGAFLSVPELDEMPWIDVEP